MILLFPGRHHLLTKFQFEYLSALINTSLMGSKDINGRTLKEAVKIEAIVFAVTSANHTNTRRNPLPFYLRALALYEFSKPFSIPAYIFGIDDVGNIDTFSAYTTKRIRHESEGVFDLRPDNTIVVCSTPVLEMYEDDGFKILPAELTDRKTWKHKTLLPWDIVEKIANSKQWQRDQTILESMHDASLDIWNTYQMGSKVQLLFRDKMISDDGDITSTRDYNTYVRQMDEIALLKFQETAPYIRPGRIGDIGCAVGSWIKLACADVHLHESDFYGIEVARHLFDICQQRKHNGEFKNPFIFFSQQNAVTGLVFDKNSMNTIHTSSLTHEIESYGSREDLLLFIKNRYEELALEGVWINRDVVGPENKKRLVLMKLNKADGRNFDFEKRFSVREDLAKYLSGLSTYSRFLRFAVDFRSREGYQLKFEVKEIDGKEYIRLRLEDACEFMSKKDYVDNWESEMHETFCFWSFEEWRRHLENAGFFISENSKAYVNEWIVKNRLEGRVSLFEDNTDLNVLDYPVTNMLMMAVKK